MAGEVQRQPFGKPGTAGQGLHHAHDFRAFFVNRDCVEIVDFQVTLRTHRVRHRTGVFRELRGAQDPHIFNALDRARRGFGAQVLAEFLVAENRQTFFERELKPVPAGHAVAGPVVEIFVPDHALDVGVVGVGGRGGVGQHVLGVENIQSLVFHGTHIEVAGRNDHETLQVQRQIEARLVPGHRGHQRVHGVLCFVQIAGAHIDLQQMLRARARADALLAADQLTRYQGKKVGRFFVRIHPLRKMPTALQRAVLDQIAVGQQNRIRSFVRAQGDRVAGHHIRAIQEIANAAKALGLALREKRVVAHIQAGQAGVLDRRAGRENLQREALLSFRQVLQHQLFAVHLERGALPIHQHPRQVQVLAIEAQGLGRGVRVAA